MNRKLVLILLGLFLLNLLPGVAGIGLLAEVKAASTTNQVVFKPQNLHSINGIVARYKLSNPVSVGDVYYRATAPVSLDAGTLMEQMRLDQSLMAVSPNATLDFSEAANRFHFDFSHLGGVASPATLAKQWAWIKTNLSEAQKSATGRGIKVAVLDTGVDSHHPLLAGKVLPGFNAVNHSLDASDVNGHGTFVAGIIVQIAPEAQIIPVRVLDSAGEGTLESVLTGLNYALKSGANVINFSLDTADDLDPLHDIIKQAQKQGVLVVAASGNDASSESHYPAAYAETLAISATDENDCLASFANYGKYIALSSPGVNIYSAWTGGGYAGGSGTSFSTAMVSGASALLLQKYPGISPDKARQSIQMAVTGFTPTCKAQGLGNGRLDFSRLK